MFFSNFLNDLLVSTQLYFTFYFSTPPSLVNELFVGFYPISGGSQANDTTRYSWNLTTVTYIGLEPIFIPLNECPQTGKC